MDFEWTDFGGTASAVSQVSVDFSGAMGYDSHAMQNLEIAMEEIKLIHI